MTYSDIHGKKFNRLTVIEDRGVFKTNRKILCECECGTIKEIYMRSVTQGKTKSCGCLQKEQARERLLKKPISIQKDFGVAAFNSYYSNYKSKAKKKELEFSLTKDEFKLLINKNCHYCNQEPNAIRKTQYNSGYIFSNGVDRIDSKQGYTPENTVACCKFCNIAKNNYSVGEFKEYIIKIYEHFIKEK